MKSLYESILDIDNNINQANINIKNVNKIKSIIHNFIDDIINTNKYSYTLLREQECTGKVMLDNKEFKYQQLAIKIRINEYKNNDYSTYTWFKSILDKHKKNILSINKILGRDNDPEVYHEKRHDSLYIDQITQQIDEYYDYNFFIRKVEDTIFITVNSMYINDIKKLIDSKNIIRP